MSDSNMGTPMSSAIEVIAHEIVDDLEAALEQFRLIAGDLNGGGAGSAV